MSYATDKWFNYIREDVLIEGVRDIGLPEVVIDRIEATLPEVSEKAKTWMGHQWKDTRLHSIPVRTNPDLGMTADDFHRKMLTILEDYTSEEAWEQGSEPGSEDKGSELSPEDKRKRILYIIQDISFGEGVVQKKPMGQWPRAFKKALKKLSMLGVPSEVVEKTREQFHFLFVMTFEQFYRTYADVFTLLNLDPTNYEYVKDENIDEARQTADKRIKNQENPDQIIHTFDDGYYWYDLQANSCSIEAERMGHCGDAGWTESTLLSLRSPPPEEEVIKHSISHVTVEYRSDTNTIYQIKGDQNSAPGEDLWPYIKWLVDNIGVTSIEESGEHSNDDFDYILNYLRENTDARVDGGWQERADTMQNELDEILQAHDSEDYSVWAQVYDEEMGQDQVFYSAGGSISFQINLGWPAMETSENEYVPMAPDGNELPDMKRIPTGGWSAERDFLAESGIADWGYELPGEETEFEYRVEMLGGRDPSWEIGDEDPPSTAHITINVVAGQETSDDSSDFDYFSTEIQSAAEDLKETAQKLRIKMVEAGYAVKTAFDTGRGEIEGLEAELKNWTLYNEGGELEFWFNPVFNNEGDRYTIIPSRVEFPVEVFYYTEQSFRDPKKQFQYIWSHAHAAGGVGYGNAGTLNFSGESLDRLMARQLTAQYNMGQRAAQKQTELEFGSEYSKPLTPLELARDLNFIIIPTVHYFKDTNGIREVTISYRLTLRVDPDDNEGEIRKTINMVKYLNKNPEQVAEAAREIIEVSIEPTLEQAAGHKRDMLDGSYAKSLIGMANRRYEQRAVDGDVEAEKATMLAMWAHKNWGAMSDVEKVALLNTYLYPLSQGALSLINLELEMDDPSNPHSDPSDFGQPVGWETDVREEMRYRGASQMTRNQYNWKGAAKDTETNVDDPEVAALRGTVGEPVAAGSMRPAGDYGVPNTNLSEELPAWIKTPEQYEENQLARVEKLLEKLRDPAHDLRIYRVRVGCALVDRVGGTDAEIAAEIRGIEAVTTVRPLADSKKTLTPTENYIVFEVKFELLGAQSRIEYRDLILLPHLRQIKGLRIVDWTAVHKTNVQGTIRTVREGMEKLHEQGFGSAFGYSSIGGLATALGTVRHVASPARPTPTPTLDSILQDWVEGGVQAYDFPTHTNDMSYHTMLPVKELWQYRSRIQRQPKDIFDAKYQQFNAVYDRLKNNLKDPIAYHEFIKNGAHGPIYLAIGKNGRIKMTGNEDLVWFAKKAGLSELPVFLSYQRQV